MFQIVTAAELAALADGIGVEGSLGVVYQLRSTGATYKWNPSTLAMDAIGAGGGSGTVTATGGALVLNALMAGAGGTDSKTVTTGTGVLTALGVNVGSAGAPVINGGALGTPASATLTNATGLPAAGVVGTAATLTGGQTFTSGSTTVSPISIMQTAVSSISAGGISIQSSDASVFAGSAIDFKNASGTLIARLGSAGSAYTNAAYPAFTANGMFLYSAGNYGQVADGAGIFYWQTGIGAGAIKMTLTNAGLLGVGVTPAAVVHIKAGTATASTAPLKFTSGAVLATPEAGAEEFLTDDRYYTITTGAARKTYARIPEQLDQTASRALNTTYTNTGNRALQVLATLRCAISLAGGNAYVQGKSDASTPPTTVVSGLVGIEAGLLSEDNTFQISFFVAPGMKFRIDSSATNGTATLGKWMEVTY